MTITLPDELRDELEGKARIAGYENVALYVVSLIINDEPIPADVAEYQGSPERTPRNREELERMLDEGMNSGPPIRVDELFWARMRVRVLERRLARTGEGP